MITLATILVAVQDLALAGFLFTLVLLARKDIPCRVITAMARRIRGESGPPSAAHPAARAVRGWERISDEEAREFERIAARLRREMPADAKWPAAGSDL